jgi:HEAT repeat protein
VHDFLRAVMEEDEDEYVRAAAAGELARRGDVSAAAALASDLEDPEEPFFFEHAVQVLAEIGGAAFYDRLAQIWRDADRDADQRRAAMLGMETADSGKALTDFAAMIGGIDDIAAMPDDQVEVAIATFVRHDYGEAIASLTALRDRIAAAALEAEERRELVGLVQEGIDLLAAD